MFRTLFGRPPALDAAETAFRALVERSRDPFFYRDLVIPDTVEGRFEVLGLHLFLVLHRLKPVAASRDYTQALFDRVFADVDRGLRDLGVGDLSVGTKIKALATGFYGRVTAYQAAIDGNGSLADALRRNLYATASVPPTDAAIEWLTGYTLNQVAALRAAPEAKLLAGACPFADGPETTLRVPEVVS